MKWRLTSTSPRLVNITILNITIALCHPPFSLLSPLFSTLLYSFTTHIVILMPLDLADIALAPIPTPPTPTPTRRPTFLPHMMASPARSSAVVQLPFPWCEEGSRSDLFGRCGSHASGLVVGPQSVSRTSRLDPSSACSVVAASRASSVLAWSLALPSTWLRPAISSGCGAASVD